MALHEHLTTWSITHPRSVIFAVVLLAVALGSQIPRIVIDTDPENMLPADQRARVFHNQVKRDFSLHDMLVVGIVNEGDSDGVFNPASLTRIHELTHAIARIDGVIRQDLLSIATVDNITQGGPGVVRFEWLMSRPPATRQEARAIRAAAQRLPTIAGTLLSDDGRAVAIYVPIEQKSASHRIATEIGTIIAKFDGEEEYFITGLPVAEDTFGVEMFKQMGIAAPLAGLLVFLLMWGFFRSPFLIIAPMIVAMVTVVATMGLLIGLGFTVHIMSSMIPIFLMPIAVVDSVHILSEFADLYPRLGDRRRTVHAVLDNLFTPMLYTSLTSAAGFASLAFAPIPPVRVFGLFVAIGITLAFILTITFIPAFIAQLRDARITKLGRRTAAGEGRGLLAQLLLRLGPRTLSGAKGIIAVASIVVAVGAFGISRIRINDNPVRWFRPNHQIRVADRVLNRHFGGTYDAFLVLEKTADSGAAHEPAEAIALFLTAAAADGRVDLSGQWNELHRSSLTEGTSSLHLEALIDAVLDELDLAGDDEAALWDEVLVRLERAQQERKFFLAPAALEVVADLQEELQRSDLVGKSNALPDIVKTVHRELREGAAAFYTIPPTGAGVAQTLLSYQSSHRPHDLWHFVTPDYRAANIWLQLKSGDNQDMLRVAAEVDRYLDTHPPPQGIAVNWAGLTYLNVVWQNDMVAGMLRALLGSFLIVFIMMLLLFRSLSYAALAMLPLSVTIVFIYGLIGLVGKDYDMPVAVLSALTLGLSVDFAIHFLQRARAIQRRTANWQETVRRMFAEPARAIVRNAIIIAIGFVPLLLSPLVPYNTVGLFLAAIMTVSCVVTVVLLPAIMHRLRRRLVAEAG